MTIIRPAIYPLIPKDEAPHCVHCGKALWAVHHSKEFDTRGRRLGYATTHRLFGGKPACFNGTACGRRRPPEWTTEKIINLLRTRRTYALAEQRNATTLAQQSESGAIAYELEIILRKIGVEP